MSLVDLVGSVVAVAQAVKAAVDAKLEGDEAAAELGDKVESLLPALQGLNASKIPENKAYMFRKALENLMGVLEGVRDFLNEYAELCESALRPGMDRPKSLLGFGKTLFKTKKLYQGAEARLEDFATAKAKIDSASQSLNTALNACMMMQMSEGPVTASQLCRHESASSFWLKYFQDARELPWEEFAAGLQHEFGQRRLPALALIKACLDRDQDSTVSIHEFASFTNELGVPRTFDELGKIVEVKSGKQLRMLHDDLQSTERFVQLIASDMHGVSEEQAGEAATALKHHWFSCVGDLRKLYAKEWKTFATGSRMPYRLVSELRKRMYTLDVEDGVIPDDVAVSVFAFELEEAASVAAGGSSKKKKGESAGNSAAAIVDRLKSSQEPLSRLADLVVDPLDFRRYSIVLADTKVATAIFKILDALSVPDHRQVREVWPPAIKETPIVAKAGSKGGKGKGKSSDDGNCLSAGKADTTILALRALTNVTAFGVPVVVDASEDGRSPLLLVLTLAMMQGPLSSNPEVAGTIFDIAHELLANENLVRMHAVRVIRAMFASASNSDVYDPWLARCLLSAVNNAKPGTVGALRLLLDTACLVMDTANECLKQVSVAPLQITYAKTFTKSLKLAVNFRPRFGRYDSDPDWSDSESSMSSFDWSDSDSDDDSDGDAGGDASDANEEGDDSDSDGEGDGDGDDEAKSDDDLDLDLDLDDLDVDLDDDTDDKASGTDGESDKASDDASEDEVQPSDAGDGAGAGGAGGAADSDSDSDGDATSSKPYLVMNHGSDHMELCQALFGKQLRVGDKLEGQMIIADPPTANVEELSNAADVEGKICLVDRAKEVPFVKQVESCVKAGAIAVVLGNVKQPLSGEVMHASAPVDSSGPDSDFKDDDSDYEDDLAKHKENVERNRALREIAADIKIPVFMLSFEDATELKVAPTAPVVSIAAEREPSPFVTTLARCARVREGEDSYPEADYFRCMTCISDGKLHSWDTVCSRCADICHWRKGHKLGRSDFEAYSCDCYDPDNGDPCSCIRGQDEDNMAKLAEQFVYAAIARVTGTALPTAKAVAAGGDDVGEGGKRRRASVAVGASLGDVDVTLAPQLLAAGAPNVLRGALRLLYRARADLSKNKALEMVLGVLAACPSPGVTAPAFGLLVQFRTTDTFKKNEDALVARLAACRVGALGIAIGLRFVPANEVDARSAIGFVDSFVSEDGVDLENGDENAPVAWSFVKNIFLNTPISGDATEETAQEVLPPRYTGLYSLIVLLKRFKDNEDVARDTVILLVRLMTKRSIKQEVLAALLQMRAAVPLAELIMSGAEVSQNRRFYNAAIFGLEELIIVDLTGATRVMLAEHRPFVMALVKLVKARGIDDDTSEGACRLLMHLVRIVACQEALATFAATQIDGTGLPFLTLEDGQLCVTHQHDSEEVKCRGCKQPIVGLLFCCRVCAGRCSAHGCLDNTHALTPACVDRRSKLLRDLPHRRRGGKEAQEGPREHHARLPLVRRVD